MIDIDAAIARSPAEYRDALTIGLVEENLDVVRFLSQPVKVHKGDPLKCNRIMDRLQNCIKVTCSAYMQAIGPKRLLLTACCRKNHR